MMPEGHMVDQPDVSSPIPLLEMTGKCLKHPEIHQKNG